MKIIYCETGSLPSFKRSQLYKYILDRDIFPRLILNNLFKGLVFSFFKVIGCRLLA